MKIKHAFTLFCVTLTLVLFLVSCADSQGNGDGGETEYTGPFEASNVSARQCTSSLSTLNCFISVWNTENSGGGASATNTIVLPLVGDGTYNFHINWGDDSEVENITASSAATHEYATPGEYTIYITGVIKGWSFGANELDNGDAIKLLNVAQWGSLSLGNTAGSQFYGAENFDSTATDVPDVSETTDLSTAFHSAKTFNQDLSSWDVSGVLSMNSMFSNASNFNNGGKALEWGEKTSAVTDMSFMFHNAKTFNQDIRGWDVSEVGNMGSMFSQASAFNQDISDWNISKVTNINTFLSSASAFNNSNVLLDWGENTSNVTDMSFMFYNATNFNQDIRGWDVSEVGNMASMFSQASAFNQDISGWNISKVTNINTFLSSASAFNNSNVLLEWGEKTSAVTDMSFMFLSASAFNQDISGWNVSEVGNMASMFRSASSFDQDISDWNVEKVTDMHSMFHEATSFNNGDEELDWGNKTSSLTDVGAMFYGASSFDNSEKPLDWTVDNVGSADIERGLFSAGSKLNNAHNPFHESFQPQVD